MSELSDGFPRQKQKKSAKFGAMSTNATSRMEERKAVVDATHDRSGYKCEARWIVPSIACSPILHCDEKHTRGRFGGVTAYDDSVTQSLCLKCDHCKENEIWAAEILGLFGTQGKKKHIPISEEDIMEAKRRFEKRKRGIYL